MAKITKREIEVKLRVRDLAEMVRRLRQMGARPRGRVFEQNTLYDTPDTAFRRLGRLLRVRIETGANRSSRVVLTSKAPVPIRLGTAANRLPRHKERLESEIEARDSRALARALTQGLIRIGLRPSFRYEKYRTSFRLGGLHLDLDETPVGNLLELEGSPQAIDRVARSLGYEPSDYIRATYWDLYAADCRKRGRPVKNMLFSQKRP